jgi:hypothetical protein
VPGSKSTAAREESQAQGRPWPAWACWLVSAALAFHMMAALAHDLAGPPLFSPLEADLDRFFWPYLGLIGQDYAHHYYAPEPDPWTWVLTAKLSFGDGQPERELRFPDPSTRPRIRFLRQIALVWHLVNERSFSDPEHRPIWAPAYAHHLCRTNPGCKEVSFFVRRHQIPDVSAVMDAAEHGETLELDSEIYFSIPEWLGDYPCNAP